MIPKWNEKATKIDHKSTLGAFGRHFFGPRLAVFLFLLFLIDVVLRKNVSLGQHSGIN
jgi:hypothetical protein